jgi:hypothetical protein
MNKDRPIGVLILTGLAVVAAILAAIHTLQFLNILPFFFGPFSFRTFNLFYAFLWGLLVWVYIWLVQMLWKVDRQAWIFLVMITIFNLSLNFIAILGATDFQDLSLSIILNGIILIYCMLPGVRQAFSVA